MAQFTRVGEYDDALISAALAVNLNRLKCEPCCLIKGLEFRVNIVSAQVG
jgi:hypothetical protein